MHQNIADLKIVSKTHSFNIHTHDCAESEDEAKKKTSKSIKSLCEKNEANS